MKPDRQKKTMPLVLAVCALILIGEWLPTLPEIDGLSVFHAMIAMPEASASGLYGISSQKAPELNLNTWIDAEGNPTAPIRLADYRGRVVYLYFFQDW